MSVLRKEKERSMTEQYFISVEMYVLKEKMSIAQSCVKSLQCCKLSVLILELV